MGGMSSGDNGAGTSREGTKAHWLVTQNHQAFADS